MMRLLPMLWLSLALGAPALAADDSIQVRREYVDRVLTLDDTAARHVALAQWCEANGLAERARRHWQEALLRDAENKEARAALGFVKRGAAWVPASETPALPAVLPPTTVVAPPVSAEKRRAISQEVQSIVILYLGAADPLSWEKGRDRILMLRDPEAAEPIFRLLGGGSVEMRKLACEALGRIPGEEAGRYLVKFTLGDPSEEVYRAAVAALASRDADRGAPMLMGALGGSEKAMKRAAYALGEMREWRAVPALITHLKTLEPRLATYEVPDSGPSMFSGTLVPYIAHMTPIVVGGVVAWKPTVAYLPIGGGFGGNDGPVTVHRTIYELVPQPMVREALTKIAGEDCEFRSQDWWKLWDKHRVEAAAAGAPLPPARTPPPIP